MVLQIKSYSRFTLLKVDVHLSEYTHFCREIVHVHLSENRENLARLRRAIFSLVFLDFRTNTKGSTLCATVVHLCEKPSRFSKPILSTYNK